MKLLDKILHKQIQHEAHEIVRGPFAEFTNPIESTTSATDQGGWQVQDTNMGTFTAINRFNNETVDIHYNYRGAANATTATTWDFSPLPEEQEVEPRQYEQFRLRLHQDDNFLQNQIKWNRRLETWHTNTNDSGTNYSLHCTSGACTDTDGTYWITSDVGRFYHGKLPWTAYHMPYIWNVYCKLEYIVDPRKIKRKIKKFTDWLLPNKPSEFYEKQLAEQKSMELLEKWLEPHEFNELMKRGELEIFAEDVVYIVSKNPGATVKKRDSVGEESHFCMIPKEMGWATGDILLSKILMIKSDPKEFERVAIKR